MPADNYTLEMHEDFQFNGMVFTVRKNKITIWRKMIAMETLYNAALSEPDLIFMVFSDFIDQYPEAAWIVKSYLTNVKKGQEIPMGPFYYGAIQDNYGYYHNFSFQAKAENKKPWFKELNDKSYLTELEKKTLEQPKKMEIAKGGALVNPITPNMKQHLKNKKAMQKAKSDHALQKKYATGGWQSHGNNFKIKYDIAGEDPAVKMLPALNAKVHYPLSIRQGMNPKAAALTYPLRSVIISLNDSYKWTREQIADWIETLDIDTTFKVD